MWVTHPLCGSAMRTVLLLTMMEYGHRIRNVCFRAGCYWSHCSGSCFFASRLVLAGNGWSRIFQTSGRFRSRGLVHCWSLTERSYQQVSAGGQKKRESMHWWNMEFCQDLVLYRITLLLLLRGLFYFWTQVLNFDVRPVLYHLCNGNTVINTSNHLACSREMC